MVICFKFEGNGCFPEEEGRSRPNECHPFQAEACSDWVFMTCIKMQLLLYVGCTVSCCLGNWADGAGSQSELRAEWKTRTSVRPFSSTVADEGSELHAVVSYRPLPLLGREMAKVGFFGRLCLCVSQLGGGFYCSWLDKKETNRSIFVTLAM